MSKLISLGRNLKFSAYSRAVSIGANFILTPYILKRVDLDLYGLNALIISIVGYFAIFDFGLSSGISRFAAKAFGEGNENEINEILRYGIRFFFIIGLLICLSLIIISIYYERIFDIKPNLVAQGRVLLLIYACSSLFVWSLVPFQGILNGIQRMDIASKVMLAISVLNFPLVFIAIGYGKSYILYIALLQVITVLMSFTYVLSVKNLIHGVRISYGRISPELKGKLIRYSVLSFIGSICGIVMFEIDHFVIAFFLGVELVAFYAIAFNLSGQIRGLNSLIGSPLFYLISSEYQRLDQQGRETLIFKATRIHSGILIPLIIIMIVNADKFILSWVGERFAVSVLPCQILLAYWLFNVFIEMLSNGVTGGKGNMIEPLKIIVLIAIFNFIISLALVKWIGITGVALGTSIPFVVASFFFIRRYCHILSIKVGNFLRHSLMPNLPHFACALALSFLLKYSIRGSINILLLLVVMGGIYLVSIMFGYYLLGDIEKIYIKKMMNKNT